MARLQERYDLAVKKNGEQFYKIERLEGALREMYSAENYEQLCEMLDEALDKECRHGEAGDCYACAASEQATDKEQT